MQSYREFKVGASNLILDLENGGKIKKLVLAGVTVISENDKQSENASTTFTSSGSFLMYPWVNRVESSEKYLFKDKNGYPLHGLYASSVKEEEELVESEGEVRFNIAAEVYDLEYPKFMETFVLTPTRLTILFQLTEPMSTLPVCFGYHPYIQLNQQPLSTTKFHTNIQKQLTLNQHLLPKFPFQQTDANIKPGEKYDSLFHGGSFFEIEGDAHSVRVESNMPYWQIYTPDEYRIAVQPMSFCGNIYKIYGEEDYSKLMTEGVMSIEVKEKEK